LSRWLPNLNALRAFEAAARLESFKAASDELGVTHVAISRHVRRLEEQVGKLLFERLSRGVKLTYEGRSYLLLVETALDEIAEATKQLRFGSSDQRLVLSVDPGFAARWLVSRLEAFRALSDVDVELIPSIDLVSFPNDSVDASIHFSLGQQSWPGLRHDYLFGLRGYPACHPSLVSGCNPLREPKDVRHHRLIHEQSTDWWELWFRVAGIENVDCSRGPIYHDANAVIEAAVLGHGIALCDFMTLGELESGRLVKPFSITCDGGAYFLLSPKGTVEHPSLSLFRQWLLTESEKQTELAARWVDKAFAE
jgi:LysR family transcriptional regulator, glycine cleavage system transcriptional activator